MRSVLFDAKGREINPPTLREMAEERQKMSGLLPVVEALSRQNPLLQDKPWRACVVDHRGNWVSSER